MINVQQVLIMDVHCVIDEYWSIFVVATCLVNIWQTYCYLMSNR